MTKEKISQIRELYLVLKSTRKVAKELGVSRDTVRKYVEIYLPKQKNEEERKKSNVQSTIIWRQRAKLKLIEYKGGKCERCGYNKCHVALEFHHLNPDEKDFTISGKSWSFERLKKEVDKCILVCSNCHKEIHYEKLNAEVVEW
jgi:5-methylcytosine-specific restriction endonuclease McrA